MSILEVSKEIIKNINTLNEKRKSINKENEKNNLNITLESKKSKYKKNRKFRITYLTTVIQFLDLNSLISLSLVNKEFYFFFLQYMHINL